MKSTLYKIGFAIVPVIIALCTGGCMRPSVPDGVLGFDLTDLYGNPVSLSREPFKGKVVLVEIWGTWCPPCIEQIPYLTHWHSVYRDRGFEIVALEFAAFKPEPAGAYEQSLREYLEERGVDYTVVQAGLTKDVSTVLPELQNFRGFPTSIFVGRDGLVKLVKSGFMESEQPYYAKTIEGLLDASPATAIRAN